MAPRTEAHEVGGIGASMESSMQIGQKALITTDAWFYAPDGRQYRAVFGTVKAVRTSEETLGVRTNARSTNWYVEIGNLTVAGCQIHYALRCDAVHTGPAKDWHTEAGKGFSEYDRPARSTAQTEETNPKFSGPHCGQKDKP